MGGLPLAGVTVLEVGGMGPGPFAGMFLADMGADVIRIDRPGGPGIFPGPATDDLLNRGKRSVVLDLRAPGGIDALMALVPSADILIEGYRPGVAERLGVGPDDCWKHNRRLVYGRMTGWGQDGPLAATAGHDIDYIAITGALHAIGSAGGAPEVPLNLLGDFGGGGTYLVAGVLAALWEAARTGEGRVVDTAIVDGVAHLLAGTHAMVNAGVWQDERGVNLLDGGAPYYGVYATADGEHMAVGAIEPKFYVQLLAGLGLADLDPRDQHDRSAWAATKAHLAEAFRTRTQAEWVAVFEGTDACVAPVVSMQAAADHPQMRARGAVRSEDGRLQPGRAPRFSGTDAALPTPPPALGADTRDVLTAAGVDADALLRAGVAAQAER